MNPNKYGIPLTEEKIADITNAVAEGDHWPTKAQLAHCVRYWSLMYSLSYGEGVAAAQKHWTDLTMKKLESLVRTSRPKAVGAPLPITKKVKLKVMHHPLVVPIDDKVPQHSKPVPRQPATVRSDARTVLAAHGKERRRINDLPINDF